MQLFYLPELSKDVFCLTEEESKHCVRVLRKKKGDQITLIDGKGQEAIGVIETDNPKKCSGNIISRKYFSKDRKYYFHLGIAPTKNFDRMEWMLEKCIEIGLDEISFLETKNSERTKVNMERCEKIAVSAMKQSKQYFLPVINEIKTFPDLISELKNEDAIKLIACCETDAKDNLIFKIPKSNSKKSILLIGPEGDFTAEEILLSEENGFTPVSLGQNILRTETAGVYGTSTFAVIAQM